MLLDLVQTDIRNFASHATIDRVPVGTVSSDRSAIVGRNSWCFIYEGSNGYRFGYLRDNLASLGEDWATLIAARQRACEALGVKFVQVIVPNKLTILPDHFPEPIKVDMTYILSRFMNSRCDAELIVPVDPFRGRDCRESIFRRTDSHLTIGGNAFLAQTILKKLGLGGQTLDKVLTCSLEQSGDLGEKFSPPISETLIAPLWGDGLLNQEHLQKIEDERGAGFTGTRQVFRNRSAPIRARVVVFGNSFFDIVPSWGISPFFAALFREFHIVWSPNVDMEYVRVREADYVIAQTCERFMTKLPLS